MVCVLISGANGGIGQAICKTFYESGWRVIATDVHMHTTSPCHSYIDMDLIRLCCDKEYREKKIQIIKNDIGSDGLKGLINNAAYQKLGSVEEVSIDDFNHTLEVNLMAPFILSKLLSPLLIEGRGCIVNIGSIHASLTKPRFVSYATSKAALQGLTHAMAVDFAGKIRVNIIQPAAIETEMLLDGFKDNLDGYNDLKAYHPSGKIGKPIEVAKLARFLLSDDCDFMNGAAINIDGAIGVRLHDPD
ncbi:MAG: SDR family NAD(P)-dependent oxidoreductase [Reinekea sp.]